MRGYVFLICCLPWILSCGNHSDKRKDKDLCLLDQVDEKANYYPQQAENVLDSLLGVSAIDEVKYEGNIAFFRGFFAFKKGQIDSSLFFTEKALYKFAEDENFVWQAKCQLLMGWNVERAGYYEQAKVNFFETIRLLNNQSCKETGLAYLGITRCKKVLKEPLLNELELGMQHLKETGKEEFALYAEFMDLMFKEKEKETPLRLKRIADRYLRLGLKKNTANAYKLMARSYMVQNKLDSAHLCIDEAIRAQDEEYSSKILFPALIQYKGMLCFLQKDYGTAKVFLTKSLELYDENNQSDRKYYAYNYLYRIDTINGDYKNAFYHLSKTSEYYKIGRKKGKQHMATVAEISSKVQLLKEENLELKAKNKLVLVFLVLGVLLFVALSVIVINAINARNKEKQRKIREKNRELQNLLVGLGEKRLLQKRFGVVDESLSPFNLQSAKNIDCFYHAYKETILNFSDVFKHLSKGEVMYAVMFALGLQHDMIAEIQNVQVASIRKVKQRIRRKLDIDANEDVEDYFQKFFKDNSNVGYERG